MRISDWSSDVCSSDLAGAKGRETWPSRMAEMRHSLFRIARLRSVAMPDDDFTPKLGRKASKDGKTTQKYGGRILVAARLAGTKTGEIGRASCRERVCK